MKNTTRCVLFYIAAFAAPVVYGVEESHGVFGVDVSVKQDRSAHAVTDAHGNFALPALASGSYTLSFRAPRAKDSRGITTDKVIVATSYSLEIKGTKRPVKRGGLTTDKLLAGVDIAVEVGPGATIRGQVLAGTNKRMVWISPLPGSNLPGHWVEEGSKEASRHNTAVYSGADWQAARR